MLLSPNSKSRLSPSNNHIMQSRGKINNAMIWSPKKQIKPVKTWKGFNLAILKITWIHYLERIEVHKIRLTSPHARLLIATHQWNLLTRPRASFETTDSFFLGFSSKYKHTHLCFFKFLWQQLNDYQVLEEISSLIILSLCEGKLIKDLTRDSQKQ